jgi:response regulator RpfG family c-di-GMP phosphodiesterase
MREEATQLMWQDERAEDAESYRFADEVDTAPWKIMIVDDEEIIHATTRAVLQDFEFEGKKLSFIHAHSKEEAKRLIRENPDTVAFLLDIVMDGEKAGLEIVRYIRNVAKNRFARIILRTGQPNEAPEEKIIREYDINDYREKTELTAIKLYTVMISALRAYRDIKLIDNSRRGLEQIIESSVALLEIRSVRQLAARVLSQLATIVGANPDRPKAGSGFVAVREPGGELYIIAGIGGYAAADGKKAADCVSRELWAGLETVRQEKRSLYIDDYLIQCFTGKHGNESFVYLDGCKDFEDWEKSLVDIFGMNVSIAIDNSLLNTEIEETQKEIMISLGEMSEARSLETGHHVKRVAEYSRLLALRYGLSEQEADNIYMASAMHDVGKMAITDSILTKPGKLTPAEFEIIKTHSTIGYEIMKNSNRTVMRAAAVIAMQHHEHYNGKGYPHGLKGEEIHLYGRITAIADVFDALGSARTYKEAWPLSRIIEYFKAEKGGQFDPQLVDIFLSHLPEFQKIRKEFYDQHTPAL